MDPRQCHAQLTIARSAVSTFGQCDVFPWRSAAAAAGLLATAAALGTWWIWPAALVVAVALVLSEVWHTKDFVTRTHVVRQRGILGWARTALPLREVENVRVRECVAPPWRRDVVVLGASTRLEFLGVRDADEACELIEALRAQVRRHADREIGRDRPGSAADHM